MKRFVILLAAGAAALASPAASAANLLTNGSFENGLAGWAVSGAGQPSIGTYGQGNNPVGTIVPTDNASKTGFDAVGSKYLYFFADTGVQTVSQLVQLEAGVSYTFGFDYFIPANGFANPYNATLVGMVGDVTLASLSAAAGTPNQWNMVSAAQTFTATKSGTASLSFVGAGAPAKDFAIDRVFFSKTSAVPEPATWGMMLLGFGAVGATLRTTRRRRTSAAA